MDVAKYFIRGVTLLATDPGLQEALSKVYETSERPRCMCVRGGVEMYIAKHGEYVIKRMPGTGDMHHPTCQSFEPEPGLSGLGVWAWACLGGLLRGPGSYHTNSELIESP